MSKHLKQAREWAKLAEEKDPDSDQFFRLHRAVWRIILHLESLESATDDRMRQIFYEESMRRHMSPSETPSSAATATEQATPPTWSTSSTWSSHASLRGGLPQSLREDISAWLSLLRIPGHVQEVEIGVTLHSKDSTSPAGSASPSIEAARPEASGPAGECCSHPIGDHTRRGWCTWTGCTCKIPPIATITDEASAISEDEWRWEGNVTRPAKMCWHCNKSPREENQILCKACVEHSTNEMVQAGVDFRRAAHDPRWLTGVPLPA